MNNEQILEVLEKLNKMQKDIDIIEENLKSIAAINDKNRNPFMVVDEKDYKEGSPEYENKHILIIKDDKDVVASYGNILYEIEEPGYKNRRTIRSLKRIKKTIISKKNNGPNEKDIVDLVKTVNDQAERKTLKETGKVNIYSDLYTKEKKLKR